MTPVDEAYQDLVDDNHSGSSELFKATIQWIEMALSAKETEKQIMADLLHLCKTHPAMAILQNFCSFFRQIPLSTSRLHAWMQKYRKHESEVCKHFASFLSNFTNILLHSNSSLLFKSLKSVTKTLNIFCTESRPALEGHYLAERLADSCHKVYLITDMAAFSVIPRVEVLAFGCDSITPRGIVNKLGTAALVEIAQKQGRMNYFIGTTEKILNEWNDDILLRQGARAEIYDKNDSIQVENYYFDLTPPELIGGVFLETGISRMYEKTPIGRR
jgi:translation initiation factor 2B subunit (eIF-2B alpha/beta/delta family)